MRKRIRFIINTLNGGGAEKVLTDLLNSLDMSKYDITLFSVTGGIHEASIPDGVKYKRIIRHENSAFYRFWAKVVRKLPKRVFILLFLQGRYDMEIAYLEGFPTRVLALKKTKAPRVAFVHCDVEANPLLLRAYGNKEDCYAEYSFFDRVCFVSRQGMEAFERAIGTLENGCVVHNVLDITALKHKAKKEADIKYDNIGLRIVTVGRLIDTKGYERLLHIVSELEGRYNFELWILGDGEQRKCLEQFIENNSIHSVKMLGFQDNPYKYMKQANLFICSSFSEGYSTAVTEAIALGIPVLTTDCSGMDEILCNGRYGWITENTESGLKQGLVRLLDDPSALKNMTDRVKDYSDNLSENTMTAEYDLLISELLG